MHEYTGYPIFTSLGNDQELFANFIVNATSSVASSARWDVDFWKYNTNDFHTYFGPGKMFVSGRALPNCDSNWNDFSKLTAVFWSCRACRVLVEKLANNEMKTSQLSRPLWASIVTYLSNLSSFNAVAATCKNFLFILQHYIVVNILAHGLHLKGSDWHRCLSYFSGRSMS